MNTRVLLGIGISLIAVSAVTSHVAADIGTQATVMPDGYGSRATDLFKCFQPDWDGECQVPKDRKIRFRNLLPTTLVEGVNFKAMADTEIAYSCALLNQRGWDCASTTSSTSNEPIQFGTVLDGALAVTQLGPRISCIDTQFGDICRYNQCTTTFDSAVFQTHLSGHTQAQKERYVRNVMRHEFMHCAGLGHNAQTPESLMAPVTTAAKFSTGYDPTSAELSALETYRP